MTQKYPHLHESVQAFAAEGSEVRIARIRADRWIGYTRADAALGAFEDLLQYPKRSRMPNVLLVGPTNNGKTMLMQKFWRAHPPVSAGFESDPVAKVPVLKIQMPPAPDEGRFFSAILQTVGVPFAASKGVARYQDAALRIMRETGVQLLIIDEVHNLLSGTRAQQRRMLNLLRWIGNELQIPLIAAGTAEALAAVQSDDQLANRFRPIGLPRWRDGEEYRQLLATLEALLPLRRPSHLATSGLASKVLAASEGILGEVVSIVTLCAVAAVKNGTEAISTESLESCGFISPSERRRVAV